MDELKTLMEKIGSIGDEINVDAVFGKPETVGDRVLIPVAEISYGFGAGVGTSGQDDCCCAKSDDEAACCRSDETEAEACCERDESYECERRSKGMGSGGGGGGGGTARPIAYIEVGPDGTKVEPIIDEQKIAFAGMLLGAWAIAWVGMALVTLLHAITGRE